MKWAILIVVIAIFVGIGYMVYDSSCNTMQKIVFENGVEVEVEALACASEQAKGLSGRVFLDDKAGMLFVYENSDIRNFWMKDMYIAIDVIWVNNGEVIGFQESIQPLTAGEVTRFQSPGPADMVLEVSGGFIKENGIEIGQTVTII